MLSSGFTKIVLICSSAVLFAVMLLALTSSSINAKEVWTLKAPIVTFIPGPPVTDQSAKLMKEGSWNVVWCVNKQELDVAQKYGLKGILYDDRFSPALMSNPDKAVEFEKLVESVKNHPALDQYFIADEPSTSVFPSIIKMTALVNKHDTSHLAYVNLYPTYCSAEGLGTKGDLVTAYQEYLERYIAEVKPQLLSYDNYQFFVGVDGTQYFLNLELVRKASLKHNIPFINVIQACSWDPNVRVPTGNELRFLTYTSVAYGAQGISHYCYWRYAPEYRGMIVDDNGKPTYLYSAAKYANRDFVAIATELMQTKSLGAYHVGMLPPGTVALPKNAAFRITSSDAEAEYSKPLEVGKPVKGFVLGYFGTKGSREPSHVVVVNLDYNKSVKATLAGPGKLEIFDPATRTWYSTYKSSADLDLVPGGGVLVRVAGK